MLGQKYFLKVSHGCGFASVQNVTSELNMSHIWCVFFAPANLVCQDVQFWILWCQDLQFCAACGVEMCICCVEICNSYNLQCGDVQACVVCGAFCSVCGRDLWFRTVCDCSFAFSGVEICSFTVCDAVFFVQFAVSRCTDVQLRICGISVDLQLVQSAVWRCVSLYSLVQSR